MNNKCEANKQAITFRGKNGNIGLTNEQYTALRAKYEYIDKVIDALSAYKEKKGITATVSDYKIILQWAEKDKGIYEHNQGSFDTDDFFEAAIRRSYGNKEIGNEIHRN